MTEPSEPQGHQPRKSWDEVGERFSEVGRRFSEHYRKLGMKAGSAGAEQSQKLNEAVKEAVAEVDRALTAVGDALRDKETKDSLKEAARSFGEAMTSTFSDLSEEIRRRVSRKGPEHTTPDQTN
jgi:gas vesicle protein